jgi:hypothetical protein
VIVPVVISGLNPTNWGTGQCGKQKQTKIQHLDMNRTDTFFEVQEKSVIEKIGRILNVLNAGIVVILCLGFFLIVALTHGLQYKILEGAASEFGGVTELTSLLSLISIFLLYWQIETTPEMIQIEMRNST